MHSLLPITNASLTSPPFDSSPHFQPRTSPRPASSSPNLTCSRSSSTKNPPTPSSSYLR